MKSEVVETRSHDDSNLYDSKHDPQIESSPTPSSTTVSSPASTNHRLFWIFIVNKDIGYLNLITYLVACFATICLIAYLSIVQPFVLTVLLGITENTGDITGSLALYDEILALPATLIWGVLSDRVGRRPIYSAGFVLLGTSMILYSYVKNVYPHMLLCRLLFSLGSAACTCMMTGTLGDIAGGKHQRGRVSAIVGMFAGFGGLVSGLVLIKVPYQLGTLVKNDAEGIQLALIIVGGSAIGLAVVLALAIPDINAPEPSLIRYLRRAVSPRNSQTVDNVEKPRIVRPAVNPLKLLKYGILAGRDPRIALAYFSSFVSCGAAAGDTHLLTGIGQGVSLAFAPLFGYAGEKLKKSSVLGVAGLIGAIGSLPFAFTKEAPAHKSNYVFVCMVGIGQIGMIVTGMSLVNGTYIDPKYRGSVAGVFSFCGAVSIMIMVKLGGYLFDVWMRGAPFVLMGIAHLLVAVFSLYVRIITPRLEQQDREMFAKEDMELRLQQDNPTRNTKDD
ncbi:hypothetical protein BGZ98_009462 [Dissophora globulifera]|nr:hypothetical protein BGZ98_009462 [Dissophora globulifera]